MIPNRTPCRKPRPDVVYPFHPFAPFSLPAQKSEKWERERFPGFEAHGILFRFEEGKRKSKAAFECQIIIARQHETHKSKSPHHGDRIPIRPMCVFANKDESAQYFPPLLCHKPVPCLRSRSKQKFESHHYAKFGRWKTHPEKNVHFLHF